MILRGTIRSFFLILLGLLACFGTSPVYAATLGSTSCQDAELWVATQLDHLPTEYEEFVALPLLHRKVVYSHLQPVDQSALWQSQLEGALSEMTMTDDQRAVILDAVQLMDSELIIALKNEVDSQHEQALAAVKALEERARAEFEPEIARALLGQLGPVEVHRVYLGDARGATVTSLAPRCECSQDSDYCPDGYACWGDGTNCEIVPDECGTFWVYDCDGLCYQPNP